MALIKCPECGKEISDKANICIHCGFPLDEYINEPAEKEEIIEKKQEFPQLPVLVAKFDKDYIITYDNGNIRISQDDDILYDGDIRNIEIHGVKKSFIDFGRIELFVIRSKVPYQLNCKDDESYKVCKKIKEDYDLRTLDIRESFRKKIEDKQKLDNLLDRNLACPKCYSQNIQVFDKKIYGARDAKIKTSYSLNLNPLKLFTVLNKKEKVVRPAYSGIESTTYRCNDCYTTWEKKVY